MNKAIEVLERMAYNRSEGIKDIVGDRPIKVDEDENGLLNDLVSERDALQTAIDHLKRKVKKDPRVDGLPEGDKYLIVWLDYFEMPFIGVYHPTESPYWTLADYGSETMRFAKTDEVMFYADPEEIQ